jgi:hypothetical protein
MPFPALGSTSIREMTMQRYNKKKTLTICERLSAMNGNKLPRKMLFRQKIAAIRGNKRQSAAITSYCVRL